MNRCFNFGFFQYREMPAERSGMQRERASFFQKISSIFWKCYKEVNIREIFASCCLDFIFGKVERYPAGTYTVKKVEQRFLLELKRLRQLGKLQDSAHSNEPHFTFNENLKNRARLLAKKAAQDLQQVEKIKQQLKSKMHREPTAAELDAKLYGLALRVQLEIFLNNSEGALLKNWQYSKSSITAPHCKLFNSNYSLVSLFNRDKSMHIEGQIEKITLLYKKHLGTGAFNDVYEVDCLEKEEQEFAMRELKNEASQNEVYFELWETETRIHKQLMNLNIPGIVQLHGIYSAGQVGRGKTGLLLEKCQGDLNILIGKLDKIQLSSIMKQIFATLNAMHANNFIHGDLKPANIFFKNNKGKIEIQIGDFGCANKIGTSQPRPKGTLGYQSLDALKYDKKVSSEVDCWAAGLIAYQLKYGTPRAIFKPAAQQKYESLLREIVKLGRLKDNCSQTFNNREFIAYIRKNYPCNELLRSGLLDDIATGHCPLNFENIYNKVLSSFFLPQMNIFFATIRQTLDPNDSYDQMIGGLLQVDSKLRIPLQSASNLIS